jgi:hypothetical protein
MPCAATILRPVAATGGGAAQNSVNELSIVAALIKN